MSDAWNEGYFTDVAYTYGYYREINPTFLRFCLLLNGNAAPEPSAESAHCELGFGQGVSLNIHAAATPGVFVGTDFNPAHATHAGRLAEASGNGARVFDLSFEELLNRDDLPPFDSISLHGIWTWISRENQAIIREFARRHLKPGGLLYISYNCFPGWSPAYPLRQLFAVHDRFAKQSHDAEARVEAALQFSDALLNANPGYLKQVPGLPERLKLIQGQNRHYLAHEYFNREWNCMYFTDVVDALAPAKLDYACSAMPLDTVNELNLHPEAVEFLKGIAHPLLREQARDYFVNQQFRKDIYLRGVTTLPAGERQQRLLDTRFILLQLAETVPYKVKGARGEADLQEDIYRPLLEVLGTKQQAMSLREIISKVPKLNFALALQSVAILVGMGVAAPCQSDELAKQVAKRCAALNTHLCQQAQYGKQIETLASPLIGGGVPVNRFQQLFLLARSQGKKTPAEWASHAWAILAAQNQKLVKEGTPLESDEENLAELTRQANEFNDKRLPVLKALQIA